MSTATHTLPGPESLPGRLLAYFKRNRDEEYTRTELMSTYDVSAGAITHALAPLLAAGWLAERADGGGNRLVIAGPNLGDIELTPGAKVAAAISTAMMPPGAKRQRRPQLPRLDVNAITVKTGVLAKPRGGREPGASPYFALLDKLTKADTWLELPTDYTHSLKNALTRYRKLHPARVFRLVKVSPAVVHVQRLQDKAEAAQT